MSSRRQREMARAALRFFAVLMAALLAAIALGALSGCGGGDDSAPADAGQCYVAGKAAPADACTSKATIQPVQCAASGCAQ